MKKKLFWYPLSAAILTIVVLYAIGNVFEILLLSWNFNTENESEGVILNGGFSFLPIILGFIVGFITERILKKKQASNTNLV